MRVLVCGGRDYTDTKWLYWFMDRLHATYGVGTVIEGDARGADRIAGYWARMNRIENLKFPADWEKHGKAAGPIRNQKMLVEGNPDLVVAFAGGRGTADMMKRAKAAEITVIEVSGRAPDGSPEGLDAKRLDSEAATAGKGAQRTRP